MLSGVNSLAEDSPQWGTAEFFVPLESLALIGSVPVVAIFTLLAAFELVADKMPWIPDRITTMSLVARGVMGAVTGACVAAAGGQWASIGAACGIAGGMTGAFAGYHARMSSAKALGVPDIYGALVEDLICVAGALWVVTRLQKVCPFRREHAIPTDSSRLTTQCLCEASLYI
jgi:uncharacterized membrane protein